LHDLVSRFGGKALHSQFLATADDAVAVKPRGWNESRIGSYFVFSHPALPVTALSAKTAELEALFLGHYIAPDWEVCGNLRQLTRSSSLSAFEAALDGVGGKYLAFVSFAGKQRLYTDPCGSLPAVYSKNLQMVASTPSLVPYCRETLDRLDVVQQLGSPEYGVSFPLEQTARSDIRRLLPNHALDLTTFETSRYWPRSSLTVVDDTEPAIAEISEILRKTISTIGVLLRFRCR
jgi:hypothetical protein